MNDRIKRVLPLFLVILLLAGVTVTLLHRYLQQREAELTAHLKTLQTQETQKSLVDVAIAARDIPGGKVLESADFTKGSIPQTFVQPYAARTPREVVGMVAAAPIAVGEQILVNKLRRQDEAPPGSTLSSIMPKGKRAVTIAVDSITGVGGFVRPGDVVDILWTLKVPDASGHSEGGGQVVTFTMFQDVPVLAVGRETLAVERGKDAEKDKEKKETPEQRRDAAGQFIVTLALAPQETSFLLFAREQGRIQLSLRSKTDAGTQVVVAPANINTLMELQLKLKPAGSEAPAKTSHEVEVYKGLDRNVVNVSDAKTDQ